MWIIAGDFNGVTDSEKDGMRPGHKQENIPETFKEWLHGLVDIWRL